MWVIWTRTNGQKVFEIAFEITVQHTKLKLTTSGLTSASMGSNVYCSSSCIINIIIIIIVPLRLSTFRKNFVKSVKEKTDAFIHASPKNLVFSLSSISGAEVLYMKGVNKSLEHWNSLLLSQIETRRHYFYILEV